MILNLYEAKEFLRIEEDFIDDDSLIISLITAAEKYVCNATGKTFDENNELAKLCIKMLVSHWFCNREVVGKADKLAYSLNSILFQLQYCGGDIP